MALFKKLYWWITPILMMLLMFLFDQLFKIDDSIIRIVIGAPLAAPLAVILSPRKKKIETQTGKKTQITWIFLKEPIFID